MHKAIQYWVSSISCSSKISCLLNLNQVSDAAAPMSRGKETHDPHVGDPKKLRYFLLLLVVLLVPHFLLKKL